MRVLESEIHEETLSVVSDSCCVGPQHCHLAAHGPASLFELVPRGLSAYLANCHCWAISVWPCGFQFQCYWLSLRITRGHQQQNRVLDGVSER